MARVLLIDDELDVRTMLRDALRLRGHTVDMAGTAEEALKLSNSTPYDVAIVDYVLPGKKKGIDLLHELRERHPFLRSIVISGQIDHDALNASDLEKELKERIAADRYLAKPASSASLNQAVEDLMKPVQEGDWKELAGQALSAQNVKKAQVKVMNRVLKKATKKTTRKK